MSEPAGGRRRGGRPTVIDVAHAAGVSKSLVSLVMRQAPQVSDEKRARVLAAAEQLGYRMNAAARSLSVQRSGTVAVLVSDLGNPALVGIVEAAGPLLEAAGLNPVLGSAVRPSRCPGGELDVGTIGTVRDLRVEGLLVIGSVPDGAALAELVDDLPVVMASAPAAGLRADAFRTDDRAGMRLAVEHLAGQGHRRIVHVGGRGGPVAADRLAGFRAAMRAHGLDPGHVAACGFSEAEGYRATSLLLGRADPPTAVVAVNDLAAVGAMSAAADRGLRVPDDLAVTGYDDSSLAEIRQISLTSVNPDTRRIGELAADRLVGRIGGDTTDPADHLLVPSLVARRTTHLPHDRKERRRAS